MHQEFESATIVTHLEAKHEQGIVAHNGAGSFRLTNFGAEELEARVFRIEEVQLGEHSLLDRIRRIDARDVDDRESFVVVGHLNENTFKEARISAM